MTKKLVFIDLDGTLLDTEGNLSSFSASTIGKVISLGHKVVIATGRPFRAAKHIYEALGLDTLAITYNGMVVLHPLDPSFKPIEKTFSKEECSKMLKEIDFPILNIAYEDGEKFYIQKLDSLLLGYYPDIKVVQGDPLENMTRDLHSFIIETEHEYDESIKEVIERHPQILCRHYSVSKHSEAFYKDGDKGAAALEVAKYYGFAKENIIAFGDANNDFTMLSMAGKGYVSNPSDSKILLDNFEQLKKSNNEDAVAHKLEELFL